MSPLEHGAALLGAGRFHEALAQFSQALQQDLLSPEPRMGLARACMGAGDGLTAVAWLSDACRVAPQRPGLWLELAGLLRAQQRQAELDAALQTAVALHPEHPALTEAWAEHCLHAQRYGPAQQAYASLYALGARDRATLLHYGFCLEQNGAIDEAVARYREALAQEPDFLEAHVNIAGVLWRLSDYAGALAHAQRAVALDPTHPYAVRILGTALLHNNRLPEAEAQLRHALALQPGFVLAEVDLALTLLLAGRLEEGWALYRQRWNDATRLARPPFFDPALEWKGPREQPLAGRRILVYAEQGRGDVIQFIRYVRLLQADGATVLAAVQPELVALVESIEGLHCLRPGDSVQVDHHVALLELPLHYGTTLQNIPAQVPYLHAPKGKAAQWRERLRPWDGVLKVGIAWSGHAIQVNNRNRSMPLSQLLPLLQVPGVQCFSLQKFDGGRDTDCTPPEGRLLDYTPEWSDFTDSAAMIENLDLVISVCTAVPHLAAALGKPTWIMLPPNADWRWLLEREDSPWYPTVRLFRRGFEESRNAQVGRVVEALGRERGALIAGGRR